MIFLLFHIGADRYAIEAMRVAEVLPCVKLKAIPQAVAGVAGVFDYHGQAVPVVDLATLASGRPARPSLSTRLLVAHYPAAGGQPRLLGLLAEHATEMARLNKEDFQTPGVSAAGAPYLGLVARDARGLLQWVEIDKLLPPAVREQLWRQAEQAP